MRRFVVADLPAFVGYRADPEIARYQGWEADYSMADARRFLASQDETTLGTPGAWVQLAVVDRATDALLGDCAVRFLRDQPATAEIGVTIARERQRQGTAGEAVAALVDSLFREYDAHRVTANADDRNTAVQRLLERLGFRCEARLVEADWFKGEWTTLRIYSVLEREWQGERSTPMDA